jgi:Fe-S cluster assembly iron-binding protein IscA
MNQTIRLLAEQAGFNLHNDPIDGHDNIHEIKKFAELIVQECMSYMEDGDIDFAKFMIKKHFGVQE